jgi:hypothetical protein
LGPAAEYGTWKIKTATGIYHGWKGGGIWAAVVYGGKVEPYSVEWDGSITGERRLSDARTDIRAAQPGRFPRRQDDAVKKSAPQKTTSASDLIDARIAELADWRGETLARIRALVKQADPEVVEEWKWRGVPTWSHDGIICTGETYKNVVKMTFAKGASLEDPSGLFNSSLGGNVRRAIDFREGDKIDATALKALIRSAVALNTSRNA